MKKCSGCKILKEFDDFYINKANMKTGLSAWCKSCSKEHKKIHYKNNKEKYIENGLEGKKWFMDYKKTIECVRCGFNHPAALDFHHIDPNIKLFQISSINKNKINKNKIFNEIDKCIVLCSNCHRIEHSIHY